MPKFKNRDEYEEWKAKKLQESKEKSTAKPQEFLSEKQPTKSAVAEKKEAQKIICPKCASPEFDVTLSNRIFIKCLQCGHSWMLEQIKMEQFPRPIAMNKDNITRMGWIGIVFGITLVMLGISVAIIGLLFGKPSGELLLGVSLIILSGLFVSIFFYAGARSGQ